MRLPDLERTVVQDHRQNCRRARTAACSCATGGMSICRWFGREMRSRSRCRTGRTNRRRSDQRQIAPLLEQGLQDSGGRRQGCVAALLRRACTCLSSSLRARAIVSSAVSSVSPSTSSTSAVQSASQARPQRRTRRRLRRHSELQRKLALRVKRGSISISKSSSSSSRLSWV